MRGDTVYVYKTSPETLRKDVCRALDDVGMETFDPEHQTWIKVNLTCEQYYPGCNTSEWFLDACIECLKEYGFDDLQVIESDAHLRSLSKALLNSHVKAVLNKHMIPFLNIESLPHDKNGLPTMLKRVQLINLPVLHTHALATISCATKNLYGLLPFSRFEYHDVLSEKLLELADSVKAVTIVDGTVGLGGGSPRIGLPQRMDILLAGWNLLAIDAIASQVAGYNNDEVPLLELARQKGVLTENIIVKGDFNKHDLPTYDLRFTLRSSLPQRIYLKLRRNSKFVKLVFEDFSPTFKLLSDAQKVYIALTYYTRRQRILNGPWTEYAFLKV